MRADKHNENSNSYGQGFVSELGAAKKILSFGGSTEEAILDSATTAYADNDIIAYAGELDVSVPDGYNAATKILIERIIFCCSTAAGATFAGKIEAGTAAGEALNGAATGRVEIFGAGATQLSPEGYALATTATEADLNFNSAGVTFASASIVLPVATKYIYVCTTTAINHASNYDAGRYNLQVEYSVI